MKLFNTLIIASPFIYLAYLIYNGKKKEKFVESSEVTKSDISKVLSVSSIDSSITIIN